MTTSLRIPNWMALLLRTIIAAIFIYAGVTKVVTPLRFITDVDNFHLLPWAATAPVALYLPWLEIFCGIALLFLRLDHGALLILLTLAVLFVLALASARARGIDVSCGCFGHATRDLSFTSHLALNLGIIAVLLLLARVTFLRLRS